MRITRLAAALLAVGILASSLSGCAYMTHRGEDALAIFDVGFTFSAKPHFAAYCGFNSLFGLGYAEFDGKYFGIGNQNAGWMDARMHEGGMLLEGYEQYGYREFNPEKPDSLKVYGVGVGMLNHDLRENVLQAMECPKFVHVGWIGFNLNCKIGQMVNFLVGWTGVDLAHNDEYLHPKPAAGAVMTETR